MKNNYEETAPSGNLIAEDRKAMMSALAEYIDLECFDKEEAVTGSRLTTWCMNAELPLLKNIMNNRLLIVYVPTRNIHYVEGEKNPYKVIAHDFMGKDGKYSHKYKDFDEFVKSGPIEEYLSTYCGINEKAFERAKANPFVFFCYAPNWDLIEKDFGTNDFVGTFPNGHSRAVPIMHVREERKYSNKYIKQREMEYKAK